MSKAWSSIALWGFCIPNFQRAIAAGCCYAAASIEHGSTWVKHVKFAFLCSVSAVCLSACLLAWPSSHLVKKLPIKLRSCALINFHRIRLKTRASPRSILSTWDFWSVLYMCFPYSCVSWFLLSSHPLQCQLTKASPELQKFVPEVISVGKADEAKHETLRPKSWQCHPLKLSQPHVVHEQLQATATSTTHNSWISCMLYT